MIRPFKGTAGVPEYVAKWADNFRRDVTVSQTRSGQWMVQRCELTNVIQYYLLVAEQDLKETP